MSDIPLVDEVARVARLQDEALGLNIQVAGSSQNWYDHLGAAEALLAGYEQAMAVAAKIADHHGVNRANLSESDYMRTLRHAVDMHIGIAMAMRGR